MNLNNIDSSGNIDPKAAEKFKKMLDNEKAPITWKGRKMDQAFKEDKKSKTPRPQDKAQKKAPPIKASATPVRKEQTPPAQNLNLTGKYPPNVDNRKAAEAEIEREVRRLQNRHQGEISENIENEKASQEKMSDVTPHAAPESYNKKLSDEEWEEVKPSSSRAAERGPMSGSKRDVTAPRREPWKDSTKDSGMWEGKTDPSSTTRTSSRAAERRPMPDSQRDVTAPRREPWKDSAKRDSGKREEAVPTTQTNSEKKAALKEELRQMEANYEEHKKQLYRDKKDPKASPELKAEKVIIRQLREELKNLRNAIK